MTQRKYGYRKDRPGQYSVMGMPEPGASFPPVFSLRSGFPSAYDQGQTMSCTGNGAAAIIQFDRRAEGKPDLMPSRKFPYFNGRMKEGWQGTDSGAMICDVFGSFAEKGYCFETVCPFEDMDAKPSDQAYAQGLQNLIPAPLKLVQSEAAIKSAILAGRPVACGMIVYSAFESDAMKTSPILKAPGWGESFLGGHCIVLVGWKDDLWEARNSWGPTWGDDGYFWATKEYFLRAELSSDFTIIPKEWFGLPGKAAA